MTDSPFHVVITLRRDASRVAFRSAKAAFSAYLPDAKLSITAERDDYIDGSA